MCNKPYKKIQSWVVGMPHKYERRLYSNFRTPYKKGDMVAVAMIIIMVDDSGEGGKRMITKST
jgi:hypothetical protein